MAKQSKILPARKPQDEESLLMRSAESLGRMIGALQRQLDGATERFSETADHLISARPAARREGARAPRASAPKRAGARKAESRAPKAQTRGASGASKGRSTADRTSKRAAKSAAVKKSAGGARSGARKAARKTRRGG